MDCVEVFDDAIVELVEDLVSGSLRMLYSSSSSAVRIAVSLLQIRHSAILPLQWVHLSTGETPKLSPWKNSPCRGGETLLRATCLIAETIELSFPKDPRGTYPVPNLDLYRQRPLAQS